MAVAWALAMLAACSAPEAGSPASQKDPRPAARCPDQQRIVADPSARRPGALRGDVDGDDSDDRVHIAIDQRGAPGCRAFVTVSSASRRLSAPIADEGPAPGAGLPALNSLAAIDRKPGLEVVVDVAAGASTVFAAVFTLHDGALLRVDVPSLQQVPSVFPYGGSVGHLEAVDCTRTGEVVVSVAAPRGRRYLVIRRYLMPAGVRWTLEKAATEEEVVDVRSLSRFREFARPPFGSCPTGGTAT